MCLIKAWLKVGLCYYLHFFSLPKFVQLLQVNDDCILGQLGEVERYLRWFLSTKVKS